ncbi:hypothetical protein AJ80_07081 [Polytolypa hystricis UAMH7299]|uniref:WLM domain-containing protein n=1 Tax=Polytolypa hystricis (strain UAMH7299) TaxID=1447883 RepID=A0A2B7XRE4_POLH7|nr:hypothetical protein AJ80_07081 [Polytolypa hystricis UAMH7299]
MADSTESEATSQQSADPQDLSITVHHHSKAHIFSLGPESTIQDLSDAIASTLSVPTENQKLLISPKPGMQKPPFPPTPLTSVLPLSSPRMKITLLGSTTAEITSLNTSIAATRQPTLLQPRHHPSMKPAKPTSRSSAQASSQYTFHSLLPLAHLPNPSRSVSYLARLRDDPGIRSAMRKHRFSVPLLTEMDPAEHTTVSSRTLGLNRNKGEVIELRLRTDAYDGYRDYRTIRKTLCHELAHCVHSEHDRDFWDLTGQIEREVEKGDYWAKGQKLSEEEFYNPSDWEDMQGRGEEVMDHGGWTGGEFVLGGVRDGNGGGGGGGLRVGLSRREILARAAEERIAKARERSADTGGGGGGGGSVGDGGMESQ